MPLGIVWTLEEDQRLAELVQIHGPKRWSQIAVDLGTKGSKQCRRRWKNFLSLDDRKQGSWTPEEDAQLLDGHTRHGNKWTLIAQEIGGRTDNAVKNRWAALEKRRRFGDDGPEHHGLLRQPRADDLLAVRRIIAKDQPRARLPAAAEAPWMQEYQNELQQPAYGMNPGYPGYQDLGPAGPGRLPELLNMPGGTAAEVPYNSQRSQAAMEQMRLQRQELLAAGPGDAELAQELHGEDAPLHLARDDESMLSSSRQRAQHAIAALTDEPRRDMQPAFRAFNGQQLQQPMAQQLQQQQQSQLLPSLTQQQYVAAGRRSPPPAWAARNDGLAPQHQHHQQQHQQQLPMSAPLIQQPMYQPAATQQQLPMLQPMHQQGSRMPLMQQQLQMQQQPAPQFQQRSLQQQMPLCCGPHQAGPLAMAGDFPAGPGLMRQGSYASSQEGYMPPAYNRQQQQQQQMLLHQQQQQQQARAQYAAGPAAGGAGNWQHTGLPGQLQYSQPPPQAGPNSLLPAGFRTAAAEAPLVPQQRQQQQQQLVAADADVSADATSAVSSGQQPRHWGPDELKQLLDVFSEHQHQQGRSHEEEVEQNNVDN